MNFTFRKYDYMEIGDFLGRTFVSIKPGDDEVVFEEADGTKWRMFHNQDCCECVTLEDVCGDWDDLVGSPITMAEEVSNEPDPGPQSEYTDSYTWTFYKLATIKGYVTLRWYGSSNGYYSESVDIYRYAKEVIQ